MPDFVPGTRYPMTLDEALAVLRAGWPICHGKPDLTRGRLFVKAPGSWVFWMFDGRRTDFDILPTGGFIVSQSRTPDPERPEPLTP